MKVSCVKYFFIKLMRMNINIRNIFSSTRFQALCFVNFNVDSNL